MKERKQLIREHLRGEHSVAELCRRFGIGRKTGHEWLRRFYSEGGDASTTVHRTLKQETAKPPASSLPAQPKLFDRFRRDYNDERPHEALGQRPPRPL